MVEGKTGLPSVEMDRVFEPDALDRSFGPHDKRLRIRDGPGLKGFRAGSAITALSIFASSGFRFVALPHARAGPIATGFLSSRTRATRCTAEPSSSRGTWRACSEGLLLPLTTQGARGWRLVGSFDIRIYQEPAGTVRGGENKLYLVFTQCWETAPYAIPPFEL